MRVTQKMLGLLEFMIWQEDTYGGGRPYGHHPTRGQARTLKALERLGYVSHYHTMSGKYNITVWNLTDEGRRFIEARNKAHLEEQR